MVTAGRTGRWSRHDVFTTVRLCKPLKFQHIILCTRCADEAIDHLVRIEHKDKAKQIGAALTELPQRQREAVQHLMVDERSLADAAVLTGRSKGSLKVSLHRALNALRLKDRGD